LVLASFTAMHHHVRSPPLIQSISSLLPSIWELQ
jgi:hypothetical protein